MGQNQPATRIGLLWRGDRGQRSPSPRVEQRLGPLLDSFRQLPVAIEHVVYADDALPDIRQQLLALDGVMVWVNPIQDGQNREKLDAVLREVSNCGVWVSAHPDTILKLGTKEVLYRARDLSWGSDVELYRSADEFAHRFPMRLAQYGMLVVKQGPGNGGDGVWKVELLTPGHAQPDAPVSVRDARATDGSSEQISLEDFLTRSATCFSWSGCLIDQPYQPRLVEGMLRCYFTQDRVIGFCRQWPTRGLLGPDDARATTTAARASIMQPAHAPAFQALRREAETAWLPQLMKILDLEPRQLPAIWDADFLYGAKTAINQDTYVLCEINTSAVWPFPPSGAPAIAATALARASTPHH